MHMKFIATLIVAASLVSLFPVAHAGTGAGREVNPFPIAGGCSLPRDVAMNPNGCLSASGVKWKDPGIVRHYRELTELNIQNTSIYKIGSISGEIQWVNADGSAGPTVPFSTSGTVPANAATLFSGSALRSARAESNAPSYRVTFTSAGIVE